MYSFIIKTSFQTSQDWCNLMHFWSLHFYFFLSTLSFFTLFHSRLIFSILVTHSTFSFSHFSLILTSWRQHLELSIGISGQFSQMQTLASLSRPTCNKWLVGQDYVVTTFNLQFFIQCIRCLVSIFSSTYRIIPNKIEQD